MSFRDETIRYIRSAQMRLRLPFGIQRKEWAIVLMATRGLGDFVANVLISMERCGVDTNLVEVVFPADAQSEFAELAHMFGARPRVLEQLTGAQALDMPSTYAEYDSPEFIYVERYRFPALRAIMAEGKRVIYSDVDVAWMRNPLPYLSRVLDDFPCAMQTEARSVFPPEFCLGFFALAGTSTSFRLIDRFIAKYSRDEARGILQPIFQDMLIEDRKLLGDIFPLPEGLFPNGLLRCVVASDKDSSDISPQCAEPFIFHGNWVSGIEKKRQRLDDAGLWFVPKHRDRFALRESIPLFSINDFRLHNGVKLIGPNLHVITREPQWSYALSFVPDQAVLASIRGDQEMTLYIELRVDEGAIGVGLLRPDGLEFVTEKVISSGKDFRTTTLRVSTSGGFSEIVLRNCSELGRPSRVVVRSIETTLSPCGADKNG